MLPLRNRQISSNAYNQDSKQKAEGEEGVYYTRERIDAFVGIIIILAILGLLVIPIYLLLHVTIGPETTHSNAVCIGILLVSALLFSASLAVFTSENQNSMPE
jgi:heme/copper-type cytochrome/quinol oxidase subunit 4